MSKMTSEKENIAAITATFHQDKRWRTFYEANRNALSGFPGIWVYCVDAGMAFTTAEKRLGIEWDGEWIDAIETFSDALFVAAKPLTIKELEATAKTCIQAMIAKNAAPAPVKADKDFFVLQMEDPDDLEDHHFLNCYAPDGSWLTMDRRDMWEDALTFKMEDKDFTLLDLLAFDCARKEADKTNTRIPCWMVSSEEAKAEYRRKACEAVAVAQGFPVTAYEVQRLMEKVPGMEKKLKDWIRIEREMERERANNNPQAFFC